MEPTDLATPDEISELRAAAEEALSVVAKARSLPGFDRAASAAPELGHALDVQDEEARRIIRLLDEHQGEPAPRSMIVQALQSIRAGVSKAQKAYGVLSDLLGSTEDREGPLLN